MFCGTCKVARIDGLEQCPGCGGVLRELGTEQGSLPASPSPPPSLDHRRGPKGRMLTLGDRTMSIAQWSIETQLSVLTIHTRLKRGWSIEKALTTPKLVDHSTKAMTKAMTAPSVPTVPVARGLQPRADERTKMVIEYINEEIAKRELAIRQLREALEVLQKYAVEGDAS